MWLVRGAAGEVDRPPPSGRAMQIVDVSVDERSSESGMQHVSVLQSELGLACRRF
ncbi:MAG TPA: hypothetical protein VJU80_07420 [Solirubrobacteraceae bacterium]|nr:hypothetical protein [Solirubrobacteraceae bacterium]